MGIMMKLAYDLVFCYVKLCVLLWRACPICLWEELIQEDDAYLPNPSVVLVCRMWDGPYASSCYVKLRVLLRRMCSFFFAERCLFSMMMLTYLTHQLYLCVGCGAAHMHLHGLSSSLRGVPATTRFRWVTRLRSYLNVVSTSAGSS